MYKFCSKWKLNNASNCEQLLNDTYTMLCSLFIHQNCLVILSTPKILSQRTDQLGVLQYLLCMYLIYIWFNVQTVFLSLSVSTISLLCTRSRSCARWYLNWQRPDAKKIGKERKVNTWSDTVPPQRQSRPVWSSAEQLSVYLEKHTLWKILWIPGRQFSHILASWIILSTYWSRPIHNGNVIFLFKFTIPQLF